MLRFWQRYWFRRQMRREAALQRRATLWEALFTPLDWLLKLPRTLLEAMVRSLRSGADSLAQPRRAIRDLGLGVPAILALLAFAGATAIGHLNQNGAGQRYWKQGERQLRGGNHKAAQIFLQKALLSERVNRRDVVFTLARSYEATEDTERADALMASLASVGAVGYPAAHRYLAIRTAERAAEIDRIDDLEAWHWHLSHADQGHSAALEKSWGMYYLVCGDLQNAVKHFRVAAEEQPALWLQVAELQSRLKDTDAAARTLATARQRLEQAFLRAPDSDQNRLLYATSLFYVGELPEAEALLKQGLRQGDNAAFRKLLAAVFVRTYDARAGSDEGIEGAMQFLRMALEYEPSYQPALTRLVSFARSSPERLEESRREMRNLISAGDSSAFAHFTLGTLEWIAGNLQSAELNMRQAVALDDRMPVVANNLAYLIARSEGGELETALKLADQAVASAPQNTDFLDTRAMIFDALGRTQEAAVDYQRALESATDAGPLQKKLAEVYERLGDAKLAAHYRQAAGE